MSGYQRTPALSDSHLAFVSEDSLWIAPRDGGPARRLTAGREEVLHPAFSPDGALLAFSSDLEGGMQVYVLPIEGGVPRRITFEGTFCTVVGFHPSGDVIFRSRREAPLRSYNRLYRVAPTGGFPERIPVGRAVHIDFHPEDPDRVVLGLNRTDSATWKRYRGGMSGDLWIGSVADQEFERLTKQEGNPVLPVFVGQRVYFISDADGFGNIWSVALDGSDLVQHTTFRDYYVRSLKAFETDLIFQKGAELFVYDTETDESHPLDVTIRPAGRQLRRKFVHPDDYLQETTIARDGKRLACTVRGKALAMKPWSGSVRWLGERHGVRHRCPAWLEGQEKQLALVTDEDQTEALDIYDVESGERTRRISLDHLRRLRSVTPNPARRALAVTDASGALEILDLEEDDPAWSHVLRSETGVIRDVAWSPDGRWLAFVTMITWLLEGGLLHLHDTETGKTVVLNDAELPTHAPAWDPAGRFLYALSERSFNPVLDTVQFGATIPNSTRLYAYVLSEEGISPFDPRYSERVEEEKKKKKKKEDDDENEEDEGVHDETDNEQEGEDEEEKKDAPDPITIDLDGLSDRIVEFPHIPAGAYTDLQASKQKVFFLSWPTIGLLDSSWHAGNDDDLLPELIAYDLLKEEETVIEEKLHGFEVAGEKTLLRTPKGLRLVKTGKEPPSEPSRSGKNRHTGWIDLGRMAIEITPAREWTQMFHEAWRLQREHFWTEDMAGVDWEAVRDRYLPLLDKVSTRAELSDLIWELQGELGTSHAYEWGGDYPGGRSYPVGLLGADLTWDGSGYEISRIPNGDPWKKKLASPLRAPGVGISEGDRIVAIDGRQLSEAVPPGAVLVKRTGTTVELTVERTGDDEDEPVNVLVDTLYSEMPLRYRDWVKDRRARVREASDGELGYLHIPDMSGHGLAEFYRAFRTESKHAGLIVDVRDNGGGFVSPLIIDFLRRQVIGYDRPRYGKAESYPPDAVRGPIVAICDQFSGSDGDMFSHAFRSYGIGPLVGKRTWGGVIGIDLNAHLADGTVVTQPEYAFCFHDVGWSIENRGVEPDVEVEYDPAAMEAGEDPQLDRAIALALEELEKNPVEEPTWPEIPSRQIATD